MKGFIWEEMNLEQKRQEALRYLRNKWAVGIEQRKEQLKQIFLVQELEQPELESYLERIHKEMIKRG